MEIGFTLGEGVYICNHRLNVRQGKTFKILSFLFYFMASEHQDI